MENIFSKITSLKNKIIISFFGIFVISVFVGIIFIFSQDLDSSSTTESLTRIYKVAYSLIALTVALVVLIDNLRKISNDNKGARILGFSSLIFGPICLVLGLLLIWEVIPMHDKVLDPDCNYNYYKVSYYSDFCYDYEPTTFAKLIPSMLYIEVALFFGSNIFSIKKNGQKIVSPMKVVAAVFLIAITVIGICNINLDYDYRFLLKINTVYYTVIASFIGTTIAAFLSSKSAVWDKKGITSTQPDKPKRPMHYTTESIYPDKTTDYDPELAAKYNGDNNENNIKEEIIIQEESIGDHDNAI